MTQPDDILVRTQALDTNTSFAVSAPAGSGKTGLLTQRVLALLGQCEQPENILAITFTKKAAAEMQNRILSALIDTQKKFENNTPPPEDSYQRATWDLAIKVLERDRERKWHLLSLPNRLRITTIDGLCRLISQQMPLTNGLGNTPEILDNAEADHVYLLAARETLALLEKEHEIHRDLTRLIKHFNNQLSTLENLLVKLLKRRDQWLHSLYATKDQRHILESTLALVIEEHLTLLHGKINIFSGELIELADYAANNVVKKNSDSIISQCLGITALPHTTYAELDTWQALAEIVLTKTGDIRKRVNIAQGFPAADKKDSKEEQAFAKTQKQRIENLLKEISADSDLIALLHQSRQLPQTQYNEQQWQILDGLTHILTMLVAQLNLLFQQHGKTDFIAITLAALNALGEEDNPSDLALILDYRIQHILVDEFQDTSTPQLELLKRLTAGWESGDGRTLFVVGDAMQSCYGFRDANVGLFLDIKNRGLGNIALTPLDLSVNFRSETGIISWCNTIFKELLPKENRINEGAVKHQHAIAFNPSTLDSNVESHLIIDTEKNKERKNEALLVADLIKKHQSDSKQKTIAVLVRTRSQVNAITQILNQQHIFYRATDLDKLDSNMIIIDLLTLTRALLFPNDRIAILSLLRAPWCGLDMSDLYKIANAKITEKNSDLTNLLLQHSDALALSQEGNSILHRLTTSLKIIFSQQSKLPLHQWIEGAWLQLGGNALLLKEEEKSAVSAFLNCLKKYQKGGRLNSWDSFVNAISQLYDKADNPRDENSNIAPVDIMTIHKSKGLEFDVVIIPGLDLPGSSDKQELMMWQEWLDKEQVSRLLISPIHATGNQKDTIYQYIRQQQKQKQHYEAHRLFYVACTRAIQKLYLLGQASAKEEDSNEVLKPNNGSILDHLWGYISETAIQHQYLQESDNMGSVVTNHPNQIIRLHTQWQKPTIPTVDLLKKYRLKDLSDTISTDNIATPDALTQRNQRYFGQVLHSALEVITKIGVKDWNETRLTQQQDFWQKQLLRFGMNPEHTPHYVQKISDAITLTLQSETGLWLLDSKHHDSRCEFALWSSQQGQLKELVVDRTFIDIKSGIRWIIDYKSSEPKNTQSLATFIESEVDQYRKQLFLYKQLFKEQSRVIKCALYFPLIDKFYEINE